MRTIYLQAWDAVFWIASGVTNEVDNASRKVYETESKADPRVLQTDTYKDIVYRIISHGARVGFAVRHEHSHRGECTKRDPDQRRIQLNSHTIQLPEQSQNLMAAPYYPLFPKGPGTERWVTPHYLQAPEQQQGVEVREHLQRVLMTSLHNTKQGDANNPFRIQEQPRTCKPTFGARSPLGLPASCKHLSP